MIEFRAVRKAYGAHRVLEDVSFSVPSGTITVVLGRSGVGKSVLLRALVGLIPIDSGEIRINGENIEGFSESDFARLRREYALVFQSGALFDSLSVFENIAFALRAHRLAKTENEVREGVLRVLREVELDTAIADSLPGNLSFGIQKRVSMARSLALQPKALFLDEPTTGLDPVATAQIHTLIKTLTLRRGVTSMLVSHDLESAFAIADQIVVLDAGRIVAQGTAEEVRRSKSALVVAFLAAQGFSTEDA